MSVSHGPATSKKGPSERQIVDYIRKASPDVTQLVKHFKKVRPRLPSWLSASYELIADLALPLASSQGLKGDTAAETSARKAVLLEVAKRVAVLGAGVITIKPDYVAPE